jgi:hypothetical protein
MSMSPDQTRTDDLIVNTISRWLARHIGDDELQTELDRVDLGDLGPDSVEAVDELRQELRDGSDRAEIEMIARETVEAVALGG